MKRKSVEALPVANQDLLKDFPHVLSQLVSLVVGEWEPTPYQQKQLVIHLAECLYCQIALRRLVEAGLDDDRSRGISEERGRLLLSQLTAIIHETRVRDDIGAYIETVEARGEEEANKEFPLFAEHLKACQACQNEVNGTLNLLRQAELTGCITPLHRDTNDAL